MFEHILQKNEQDSSFKLFPSIEPIYMKIIITMTVSVILLK